MHEEDDLACFDKALAEGDPRHAAHHLAGIVAGGRTAEAEGAVGRFVAACDEPLAFATLGESVYVGVVVLRAILVARRAGGADEAMSLLLQAQAALPDVDLLGWVRDHLAQRDFVAALDLDRLSSTAYRSGGAPAAASRIAPVLDVIRRAREPHGVLAMTAARVRRISGDLEGAIAVAEEEHARAPSYSTAIARGAAYRERGDTKRALAAYRDALDHDPEDAAARLDIGDLLVSTGDLAGASTAYAEVLARDPQHEWAWPSQLYLLARGGDAPSRDALGLLAAGGNTRARSLYGELEPFSLWLEPPDSSIVNAVREALAKGAALTSIACSSLEPPSVVASVRRALRDAGAGDFEVSFGEIPSPDPRVPRGEVGHLLWKYDGQRAEPALAPPREEVARAIAAIATESWNPKDWARRAEAVDASPRDVLATMVHPPAAPEGVAPWDWLFHVHVAAAFVACRLDRDGALVRDLLRGPIDWTTTAAIVALSATSPSYEPLVSLVETPKSPIHFGCVVRPVVYCLLRRDDLPPELREALAATRAALEGR